MQMASFQRAMNRRPGGKMYENTYYIYKYKIKIFKKNIYTLSPTQNPNSYPRFRK